MFQEYPKWVPVKGEDAVLVHSAEEEAKVTGASKAAVEKTAAKNEAEGEAAQAETDAIELQKLADKGSAVSEADMVKITGEAAKRAPGRPRKSA